jgi:hypothetical protein
MKHNWILDVLTDLKTFAAQNELPALAEQLGDTQLVASVELTESAEERTVGSHGAHHRGGTNPLATGARYRA